jgi:hypothetical protein
MRFNTSLILTALGASVLGASVLGVSLLAHAASAPTPTLVHPPAASGASYNETPAPIVPANSPSAVVLTREQIDAKVADDQGGRHVFTRLITWNDFLGTYTPGTRDPQIDASRKVWVVQNHYPDGYQTKRGLMSNAVVTAAYDAETGQVLGVSHKSLATGQRPGL